MKFYLLLFCYVLTFSSVVSCQSSNGKAGVTEVELLAPTTFLEEYEAEERATLIDCRTPQEVSRGTIVNAINVDYRSPNFDAEVDKLPRNVPIYIYCQAGGRSAAAAEKLIGLGFEQVHDMKGGYGALKP